MFGRVVTINVKYNRISKEKIKVLDNELMQFAIQCVHNNNLHALYTCWDWLKLRYEVLRDDKHECQCCKAQGKYTKATMVHHEKPVKEYPELAFSKIYVDEDGKERRQLISLCNSCHEEKHPARRLKAAKVRPITEERW